MLLGTCTTRMLLRDAMAAALFTMSSPPMQTRASILSLASAASVLSRLSGSRVTSRRDEPSRTPPSRWMRETSSTASSCCSSVYRCASQSKPSWKPMGTHPSLMASMATALMTPLVPGAGPPPTTMPMRLMFTVPR